MNVSVRSIQRIVTCLARYVTFLLDLTFLFLRVLREYYIYILLGFHTMSARL